MKRQDERYLRRVLNRAGVLHRRGPRARIRLWLHDNDLLHYCVRCDRLLLPWQRCPHNGRWMLGKFDR